MRLQDAVCTDGLFVREVEMVKSSDRSILADRNLAAWDCLAHNLRCDIGAWLLLMAALSIYRAFLAWPQLIQVSYLEMSHVMWMGARFDSVISTLAVLPTVTLAGIAYLLRRPLRARRIRHFILGPLIVISVIFYAANFEFHKVFGTQIDQRALALLEDRDGAVRATVWQAYHPIMTGSFALICGVSIAMTILALVNRVGPGLYFGRRSAALRFMFMFTFIIVTIGLLRGFSWGETPVRIRNAYVSQSVFLNRLIPSPYAFLWRAMEDRSLAIQAPSASELAQALAVQETAFGKPVGTGLDLNSRLSRLAHGSSAPARHIFLILLEGQHGFPLLPKYRSWGLFPGLADLADQGALFEKFLPTGRHTDNTLSALVAGALTPDFVLQTETGSHREFPTSIAPHFNRMGYRTGFFYGGYAGWERLDEFVLTQGFQFMQTAANMPDKTGNAWGVWDQHLFDHVLTQIEADKPSFSMILTTTNHSPFNLDDELLPKIEKLPEVAAGWDKETLKALFHEIYVDRQVTRFVHEASKRFPGSLFVITGDHTAYGASFTLPGADALDNLTVPLILTGDALPKQLRGRYTRPASHLDIAPTLYGLNAPTGFIYRSLGNDLFSKAGLEHGLGQDKIIIDGWIADVDGPDVSSIGASKSTPPTEALALARSHHGAARVISRAMLHERN
jgi:phosphoglycerol transferase MdoB-like AlkP superfamily enzyme